MSTQIPRSCDGAPRAPPRANDVHRGRRRIVREFVRILRRLCRALQVPRHARARVHRGRLPGAHRPRVATQRHVVVQARARRHVLPRVHHPTRRAQVRPEQGPASRRATFQSLPRPARERTRRTRRRRREGSRRGSNVAADASRTDATDVERTIERAVSRAMDACAAGTLAFASSSPRPTPRDFRSSEAAIAAGHALVAVVPSSAVGNRRRETTKRSGKVVATRRTRQRRRRRWPPRLPDADLAAAEIAVVGGGGGFLNSPRDAATKTRFGCTSARRRACEQKRAEEDGEASSPFRRARSRLSRYPRRSTRRSIDCGVGTNRRHGDVEENSRGTRTRRSWWTRPPRSRKGTR